MFKKQKSARQSRINRKTFLITALILLAAVPIAVIIVAYMLPTDVGVISRGREVVTDYSVLREACEGSPEGKVCSLALEKMGISKDKQMELERNYQITERVILLGYLIHLIFFVRLSMLRLHDLGKSGWHVMWIFVPFVNLYMAFLQVFIKGSDKPNKWGKPVHGFKPLVVFGIK